ncbi:MAG: glycosyltransferase family 4 protein [Vicinamibacterales bacterium]
MRPRLLVVSHVLPFPPHAGQHQRVHETLRALRRAFEVAFLTTASRSFDVAEELSAHCDEPIVIESPYRENAATRHLHRAAGLAYMARTGLRWSNFAIGRLNLSPDRVAAALSSRKPFDVALFEYWHAVDAARLLRDSGVPCVLDMHDVLWQARRRQLEAMPIPAWWTRWAVARYRRQEEAAWPVFEGIVAINRAELAYVAPRTPASRLFLTPMGTDLKAWAYAWEPLDPPRIAFYGALSTRHNQESAIHTADEVMPRVWKTRPDAELWIVGSNPPERIRALGRDPRVHVTGFVDRVQPVLATMSAVVCPWTGTYGFRSRLIEVMALGVPVVASPDAVYGMDLEHGDGIRLAATPASMAADVLQLLDDSSAASAQSRRGRAIVERRFSVEATYDALTDDLREWLLTRRTGPRAAAVPA